MPLSPKIADINVVSDAPADLEIDEIPDQVNLQFEDIATWKVKWSKLLKNPVYGSSLDVVNFIFELMIIAGAHHLILANGLTTQYVLALVINTIFLFDMIGSYVILGWKHVLAFRTEIVVETIL